MEAIYLTALLLAVLCSFFLGTKYSGLSIIRTLLLIAVLSELGFKLLSVKEHTESGLTPVYRPYYIYHFYVVLEFVLLVRYFSQVNRSSSLNRLSNLLVVLFIGANGIHFLSNHTTLSEPPSLFYNVSAIINVIFASVTLFRIEPHVERSILSSPTFWICSGTIVFFSAIFVFNGVAILAGTESFTKLQSMIVKSANIFLYLSISYAFVCSKAIRT